jgi:hypothetical protein
VGQVWGSPFASLLPSIVSATAHGEPNLPNPVAGDPALAPFHLWAPGGSPINEPSSITDFHGKVAIAELSGTGTDEKGNTLYFDNDMRVIQGTFIARNGRRRRGTFGFI